MAENGVIRNFSRLLSLQRSERKVIRKDGGGCGKGLPRINRPCREFRSSKGTCLLCIFTIWAMCHRNPQRMWGERGGGTSTDSFPPCGITLWRWKVLFGKAINPPTELLSQFRWSAACLAGPISGWEAIGVLPSPSARVEEKSGPLSVEMSLISASMWQGPMNSKDNTPFTGSSMHESFNRP